MGIHDRRYMLWAIIAVIALMPFFQSGVAFSGDKIEQKAKAIAEKVEQKAERTEKAEGKHDLVKDKVEVNTDVKGKPVVEQLGEASWYGNDFHGKQNAGGETFNQHNVTAAHPTLPLGTEATVTNLETGKSVELEITDRGPYSKGRDIDLSKRAAEQIGMKKTGTAPVKIEAKVMP